jgi:D-3-phosphoglycerate dehydrogenase
MTPHLGASTEEAQVEVAVEVADQVMAVLAGQAAPYTINVPFVPAAVREALSPYIPVATVMGRLAIQLSDGQLDSVAIKIGGDIAEFDSAILGAAAFVGVLGEASDVRVNLVNATPIARERGINLVQERDPEDLGVYANFVGVEVRTSAGTVSLVGTSVSGRVHVLRINDFYLDMEPNAPYMLFTTQVDQPGMIGKVGTIAGTHDANISFMEVGRDSPRGQATMIVGFDDTVTDALLADIKAISGMTSVRLVRQEPQEVHQPRLRKV